MSNEIIFDEDEKDCLQELMNIAYGSATAAIADIIDAFATLSIPTIEIIDASNLKSYLASNLDMTTPHLIATQLLNGELSGENIFIIDSNSAISMAQEFDLADEDMEEEELHDIVLEITNILSSSITSSLISEMKAHATFSPPSIKTINSIDDLNEEFISDYTKVIIISTQLTFEAQNINGTLMMLTTDKSILYIKNVINSMLEDF
ncbi:MAG: chemotaxis protein CheX [Arcobacteraceae bacterium]|nr:chemotaxis protein CheX [Arcobacteraceae bacterium]